MLQTHTEHELTMTAGYMNWNIHERLAELESSGENNWVFLDTILPDRDNCSSFLFTDPVSVLSCGPDDDIEKLLQEVDRAVEQGLWVAGYLAYEAGHLIEPAAGPGRDPGIPLAWFGLYRNVKQFNHFKTSAHGRKTGTATSQNGKMDFNVKHLGLDTSWNDYRNQIKKIRQYIENGDTYQVNHTVRHQFTFTGSAIGLYEALRVSQPVPYGALIRFDTHTICSFSPELFFSKRGRTIKVQPMKGTARRGRWLEEDIQMRSALAKDEKNRAENVMITDMMRNDLGRIAAVGSVVTEKLFDVKTFDTLLQMVSDISAQIAGHIKIPDLFRALFPSASITGAPKVHTMQIIRETETSPRGIYTGSIGYFSPSGNGTWNVAIRTLKIEGTTGHMGTGGGIVWDSKPRSEYREARLKAEFFTKILPEAKLIETMRADAGSGIWLEKFHIKRITRTARWMGFALNRKEFINRIRKQADAVKHGSCKIRVLLERNGTLHVTASPLHKPLIPPDALARISTHRVDPENPMLFHKTTRRALYNREFAKWSSSGYTDVIFLNKRGQVSEGATTNVFILRSGIYITPPLKSGCLPGTLRSYLLQTGQAREEIIREEELHDGNVYLGNSVRGLFHVKITGTS